MNRNKKIIYIVSAAVVLILIIIFFVTRSKQAPGLNSENVAIQRLQAEQNSFQNVVALKRATDQDLDGLTDAEEAKLGTDPRKSDADGDGLSDYDEVKLYQTNPLKADSYGIGHSDSWGVKRRVILPGGKIDRQALANYK